MGSILILINKIINKIILNEKNNNFKWDNCLISTPTCMLVFDEIFIQLFISRIIMHYYI